MPNIVDLIGLNQANIAAMPIVDTQARAIQQVNSNDLLSIAGSRHSQGGHTMFTDAPMLLTECMNEVVYDEVNQTVTAGAGATWNNVQHLLYPHGRSILVQQSTSHFTIGGSLSVNCHGRDPRQGPLSSTAVSIKVLLSNGDIQIALPGEDLFKAVVGGYGSCGMILSATFNTCPNHVLERKTSELISVRDYAEMLILRNKDTASVLKQPELHYAWLNISRKTGFWGSNPFYTELFYVDYTEVAEPPRRIRAGEMGNDSWIANDGKQIAWAAARDFSAAKNLAWEVILGTYKGTNSTQDAIASRTQWLRESVNFIAGLDDDSVDLLVEFFVPLTELANFVDAMKIMLLNVNVNVLSSTIRVVQADSSTHLSYCPTTIMASLVIDFCVPTANGLSKKPAQNSVAWVKDAIDFAVDLGGTYYLPYYDFEISPSAFQRAYPNHASQAAAMTTFDSNAKFKNAFIEKFLR